MIPITHNTLEPAPWQTALSQAVTDPLELLQLLGLDVDRLPSDTGGPDFPLRVPRFFVDLMRKGDPDDPLLRQVLPTALESLPVEGYVDDPVGDLPASHANGLLHKYQGRALLITTGACAVHCRYCFRRHFPYQTQSMLRHWSSAIEDLRGMRDCHELILSGGDPLSLSDRRLSGLLSQAEALPQLQRLRIHTRLPVVLPNRVTPELTDMLANTRLQTSLVIHANHRQEISPELGDAMRALAAAGVVLLNQSVLLKSVNDDADVLSTLSESLFQIGVLPYYLHLLDPVAGAAHFDVSVARAEVILEALRRRLPGYLVPRMVKEVAGEPGKTPLEAL